nr:hypothetical protein [Tanacetum cinerariifolium]
GEAGASQVAHRSRRAVHRHAAYAAQVGAGYRHGRAALGRGGAHAAEGGRGRGIHRYLRYRGAGGRAVGHGQQHVLGFAGFGAVISQAGGVGRVARLHGQRLGRAAAGVAQHGVVAGIRVAGIQAAAAAAHVGVLRSRQAVGRAAGAQAVVAVGVVGGRAVAGEADLGEVRTVGRRQRARAQVGGRGRGAHIGAPRVGVAGGAAAHRDGGRAVVTAIRSHVGLRRGGRQGRRLRNGRADRARRASRV